MPTADTAAIRLGVNIDHIATLRNARGTPYPSVVAAALASQANGADGITAHLREDRRHVKDADLFDLKAAISLPLNMEMANTDEMVAIALTLQPHMVTLVPERREELTTEGGLDVITHQAALTRSTQALTDAGIRVSLFIEPDNAQVDASKAIGAELVEFHTGKYCHQHLAGDPTGSELQRLHAAAQYAVDSGVIVNAGHGLTQDNVGPVLSLPGLYELNIGHAIVADAVVMGMGEAVATMNRLLKQGR